MFAWIAENLATIIICLVLAVIVAAIIIGLVRNKKKGKSSCGCNCATVQWRAPATTRSDNITREAQPKIGLCLPLFQQEVSND